MNGPSTGMMSVPPAAALTEPAREEDDNDDDELSLKEAKMLPVTSAAKYPVDNSAMPPPIMPRCERVTTRILTHSPGPGVASEVRLEPSRSCIFMSCALASSSAAGSP